MHMNKMTSFLLLRHILDKIFAVRFKLYVSKQHELVSFLLIYQELFKISLVPRFLLIFPNLIK